MKPRRRILSHIARCTGKPIRYFLEDSGPDEGEIDGALDAFDISRAALARLELAAARVQRGWTPEYDAALAEAQVLAVRFARHLSVARSRYALAVTLHAKGYLARARHALIVLLASLGDSWPDLRARCIAELNCIQAELGDGSDDTARD